MRYFATAVFMIQNIIYVGMVIYMPALALETVTSLSKWAAVWLTAGVCIFYTALGPVQNNFFKKPWLVEKILTELFNSK